ncbi:BadF/BadG/BcrA/BcrD ATPase family protein [Vibrio sp. 10N.247.311.14]|uniref:N-acetylglucosamine kinase n=1 Tax=unclassified Vibrio TaxID=2614977 RepID=UPI000C84428C|nr:MULTISPECIES: N-acetylglucosamine kinase [unclassified Vibrio]PMK20978.1 N-acetylglucosamine kinase [Vibrio sp. 10N.261.54.C3]PMN95789.1 N-acetylglucosamine kinase [Vibrio sp. 10N.222.55.F9]PMO03293.1 N-acetylglucosamine kinase [Vibrio sp. 10N.222.55.C12]PMO14373.1 N-acetylglucosamine kinase [Vibrio sp. 10N.222.54.F10]PMO14412.1 N-acetylglucosamine kinase [Vibrio sp. 10N.222.54.B6]
MTLYYVGIDGGGTSCRARIRDAQGKLIGEAKSGSANILLGVDVAMSSIIDAITKAAQQGQLNSDHFSNMHVGLALAGAEQKSAWFDFMAQPHPFASMTLNTDAYGACIGAHNGQDGAIMIGGTGSCGIFLKDGEQYVVGGREFPISDQGGGAVMGLRLIQQVLLAEDGIRNKTPLTLHVMNHFNNDVDAIVEWSKGAIPKDYGQFSPVIFQLANEGDELAIEMLKQTAADIEMFVLALHHKGADKVCLMGSIAERILNWLSPPVQQWIVKPQFDAIEGALMFAGKPQHNLYQQA